MGTTGFEPAKAEPAELKSAPFDHSGTCPEILDFGKTLTGFEPVTLRLGGARSIR